MIDYLNAHPTSSEILAAVHEVKSAGRKVSEQDFEREFGEVSQTSAELAANGDSATFPYEKPDDTFLEHMRLGQQMMEELMGKKAN